MVPLFSDKFSLIVLISKKEVLFKNNITITKIKLLINIIANLQKNKIVLFSNNETNIVSFLIRYFFLLKLLRDLLFLTLSSTN
jgi:hypothetical protein